MAQRRKRVKYKATFEQRLAEEAIKFKEAAEKEPPGSTARERLLRRARQTGQRLAAVPRVAAAEVGPVTGTKNERLRLLHW